MSDVKECKARVALPDLWRRLDLPGEPRTSMHCPFREDRNESFSVFEHKGAWFWKDHGDGSSGDEVDLICRARGVDKREAIRLYCEIAGVVMTTPKRGEEQRAGGGLGRIVRTYDYLDAEGRLVHQTVRFEPKNFRQRRPARAGMMAGGKSARMDARGQWWMWSLVGIQTVLYRLPELLARTNEEVWITEGEKDADALAAKGVLATTCPMGARKWRSWYSEVLAGRRVTLCGDSDAAGVAHVDAVGRALLGVGCVVQVVDFAGMGLSDGTDGTNKSMEGGNE